MNDIRPVTELNRREHVVHAMLELIRDDEWTAGTQLPTETELAAAFRVSRTVIREAMKSLQAMGIVSIEQGRGTFVSQQPLAQPFSLWASINLYRLEEVYEVREFLEAETAARAAKNATEADLEAMRLAHVEFEQAIDRGDWVALVRSDHDFHRAIASATGMPLLAEMLEVTVPIWTSINPNFSEERGRAAANEHSVVLVGVSAREERAARTAMSLHIQNAFRRLEGAIATRDKG